MANTVLSPVPPGEAPLPSHGVAPFLYLAAVPQRCVNAWVSQPTLSSPPCLQVKLLSQAMVDLGVFRQSPSTVAAGAYREFYPTSVGETH